MEIIIKHLNAEESVELILYHTKREINKHDFNLDGELQCTVKNYMIQNPLINKCKGLPKFLLGVAKLLNGNNPLWKIRVEK